MVTAPATDQSKSAQSLAPCHLRHNRVTAGQDANHQAYVNAPYRYPADLVIAIWLARCSAIGPTAFKMLRVWYGVISPLRLLSVAEVLLPLADRAMEGVCQLLPSAARRQGDCGSSGDWEVSGKSRRHEDGRDPLRT